MNFWPNSKFWKENDCPDSMSPRGDAILLMTGSFNPIHRAHIHSMEAARISVEKSGYRVICGYLSPSHDSYVQSKIKKVIKKKEKKKGGSTGKGGCFSFNNKQRLSLASLSIEDNDWIDIGTWETMGSHDSWPDYPEVCSHLANHLKEKARFFNNDQNKDQNTTAATESEQKLTLFYVCGMDHYIKCDPSTALGYEITNCKPIQLGVVVVDRNDTTMINSSTGGGGGGVSGAFRGGSSSIVGMSNLPLGAAPPKETNTSKNKAKKDKKKKAIEADAAARAEMEKLKISSPSSSSVASTTEPQAPAEPVDKAKRLKKLEKSLKAIAGIKEKVAAGNEINADQKTKLSSEQDILTEIEQLNAEM
mmetsp:Transcript_30595/g.39443  ORF Transcript_30595/g.39443 Transcript_30595/m.39443 type:complete len:362 (-) Transcript_30595:154-1239(-)